MRYILAVDIGGGFGDPAARSRDAIIDDVRNSYISGTAAEEIYGASSDSE